MILKDLCIVFILNTATALLLQTPEDTEAIVGSRITLRCQTDLIDPIEWNYKKHDQDQLRIIYKRGTLMGDRRNRMAVNPDNSSGQYNLIISNVTLEDAGVYTCQDMKNGNRRAQLVVFDLYPSDTFCSMNLPSDGVLGSNICGLEPDSVKLTCKIRYRGNLTLNLEWSNGDHVMRSYTNCTDKDGTCTSTTHLTAEGIKTSSPTFTCRIKYEPNTISSKLIWSTTLDVKTIVNTSVLSNVGCDTNITDCAPVKDYRCNFTWSDNNGTVFGVDSLLELTSKPIGNYTCVSTCRIRQKSCPYVAKRLTYICDKPLAADQEGDDINEITASMPGPGDINSRVLSGITVTLLLLFLAIGIMVFLKRKCERRNSHNSDQNTEYQMNENVQELSVITTSEKQHFITNNSTDAEITIGKF